ncbi:MAG: hypothetical protein IJR58_02280 [Lachnospiraceae bacterium]|nr:hypothetical protein [Lachnospiraceae bacterium]
MIILAVSILIIVGLVLMIAGFVLPAHDDTYNKDTLDKEIKDQVKRIVAGSKRYVQEMVDTVIGDNIGKTTRALDRMTNEKIQSISEYSDTVMNEIHKNHDEVVFMFDMLNDKHMNLKETASEVTRLAKEAKEVAQDAKISAEETYTRAKGQLDLAMENVNQLEEAKRTELAKELASIKAYAKQTAQDRLELERSMHEIEDAERRRAAEEAARQQEAMRQRQLRIEAEAAKIEAEMKAQAQARMMQATSPVPVMTGPIPPLNPAMMQQHIMPDTVYLDGQPLPQHEVSKEIRQTVAESVTIDGQRTSIPDIVNKNEKKIPESFTKMMQPESYDTGMWFGDVKPTASMRRAAMERLRDEEEERKKRLKKNMNKIDVSRSHVIGAPAEGTKKNGKVVPISSGNKGANAYRDLLLAGKDLDSLSLNDHILLMHHQGKSNMAIARELGLGIGEVTLVIDLSKKGRVVKETKGS